MRRSRKFEEELALRKKPSAPVDEVETDHGFANEALRLQELVGNANTTAAIARSALQRDRAGTEAEPAKGGEEVPQGAAYTMTVSDLGTFDVESWSWGDAQSGAGGGGGGAGKVKTTQLNATKKVDKFSTELMLYSASGQHIKTVELRTEKSGVVFVVELTDVNVDSFRTNDGDPPVDNFTLSFADVEFVHGDKEKDKK